MSLANDPLIALGPSLFLQILSHLPLRDLLTTTLLSKHYHELVHAHSTSLFRHQARAIGVEAHLMDIMEEEERKSASASTWASGSGAQAQVREANDGEGEEEGEDTPGYHWREVCKKFLELRGNWRAGRAREQWITPGRNTVWRMKVDHEENTIITTSRLDGILVSDLETSDPIFEYEDQQQYAHLEFAKGFVIFNVSQVGHGESSTDHGLEVHLTPSALRRLPSHLRNNLPNPRKSQTYDTAYSFPTNDHYTPSPEQIRVQDPPRGHLTYFRTINPPTPCFAFRARVDREHQADERAVLATAGEEGVYVFDLEDEGRVERYAVPEGERRRPNYIELDDDYIFICGRSKMHVYSRRTRAKLLSFPKTVDGANTSGTYACPGATAFVDPGSEHQPGTGDRDDGNVGERASIKRAYTTGASRRDMRSCNSDAGQLTVPLQRTEFTACHYTPSDLFCTTKMGLLIILRDYKSCLGITDAAERARKIRSHTMVITFGETLRNMTIHGEHVIFGTPTHLFMINASALPAAPFDQPLPLSASASAPTSTSSSTPPSQPAPFDPAPQIPIFNLPVHPAGLEDHSCLQADREAVYSTYWALGEMNAPVPASEGGGRPPERATADFGICVKKFWFGVGL